MLRGDNLKGGDLMINKADVSMSSYYNGFATIEDLDQIFS